LHFSPITNQRKKNEETHAERTPIVLYG